MTFQYDPKERTAKDLEFLTKHVEKLDLFSKVCQYPIKELHVLTNCFIQGIDDIMEQIKKDVDEYRKTGKIPKFPVNFGKTDLDGKTFLYTQVSKVCLQCSITDS